MWVALPAQPGEGWVPFLIATLGPLVQHFCLSVGGKHVFPLLLGKIITTIVLKMELPRSWIFFFKVSIKHL